MSWAELPDIVRVLAALAFIIVLMGGLSFVLKKLGLAENVHTPKSDKPRLRIVESLPLDARRRLVLLQRDDKQHLVILSASGETVVETDIEPKETDEKSA